MCFLQFLLGNILLMLQEVTNFWLWLHTQLSKAGIAKWILSLVSICWSVVFLNVVKHICARILSCQYRSMSAFVLAVCVCQNKGTCSFAFHSVAVSVFILGIFFYLKFYYLSLQISVFKSCLCYSSPGKNIILLCRMASLSVALIIHSASCCLCFVLCNGEMIRGQVIESQNILSYKGPTRIIKHKS